MSGYKWAIVAAVGLFFILRSKSASASDGGHWYDFSDGSSRVDPIGLDTSGASSDAMGITPRQQIAEPTAAPTAWENDFARGAGYAIGAALNAGRK